MFRLGSGTNASSLQRRRAMNMTFNNHRSNSIAMQALLSCLIIQRYIECGECFAPSPVSFTVLQRQVQGQVKSNDIRARRPHNTRTHSTTRFAGGNNDDNDADWLQRVDDFLDKPFFDPDDEAAKEVEEGEGGIKSWFANLVLNDYATAEALYAGLFFSILLLATQEALRYYMYGADYVPFTRGGGGKLF